MVKRIALGVLALLLLTSGCTAPVKKNILELKNPGEKIILEGVIKTHYQLNITCSSCYLVDDTGRIQLRGDDMGVMESLPPGCLYIDKKVRITGTYQKPICEAICLCDPHIIVEKVEET